MKTMVIPATEVSQFWNILKRFAKRERWTVMFKNHHAIFTASMYGGNMLSYSAKYEGPDDDRTFYLWPNILKYKSSAVVFALDDRDFSGRMWHKFVAEGRYVNVSTQEKQEFDDINEDGVETPADMPKILKRLIKIRRGIMDQRDESFYFEGYPGWQQAYAISTDGIGMIHTRFPLLRDYGFSIPTYPMKCLPGSGLISFYDKNNTKMLCYQSGGWLYATQTGNSLFNSTSARSRLLSIPHTLTPTIKIDKSDFKAIIAFTSAWRAWEWRRKKPIAVFKTDQHGKVSVEFQYGGAYYGDKPAIPAVLLEKTKWVDVSVPRFSAHLMELRNAMSAGFNEFKVVVEFEMTIIKSESKGMRLVASSAI